MAYFTENYIPALLEFCSTPFSVCFIQDSSWIHDARESYTELFLCKILCFCFLNGHKLLKWLFIP